MADEADVGGPVDTALADAACELAAEDERNVVEFLRSRNVPCPLCGYNLRGLTAPRCPECGRSLRLSIGQTEPFMRAWIALAFFLFATSGMGILLAIAVLSGKDWPNDLLSRIAVTYLFSSSLLSVFAVIYRRRLLRLKQRTQWDIAFLALVMAIVALCIFFNAFD